MHPKQPREKSKTRLWEKERRIRLTEAFTKLSEVLPCYDSAKTFSKIEILEYAQAAIKDLDEKLKAYLCPQEGDRNGEGKLNVSSDIIKKLQDRVKKLLVRNEQLCNLLKNAGIKIPRECSAIKRTARRYKDVYKLSETQIKNVQKELEKENQIKTLKPKVKRTFTDLKPKKVVKTKKIKKKSVLKISSSPNCVFIVSQPNLINSPCYILAKDTKPGNQTVITNSVFLKAPIVSSNIKPATAFTSNPATNLAPGTFFLSNGTVMPILPTPQALPILPTILNPISNNLSTLIVVSSNTKTPSTNKITISRPKSKNHNDLLQKSIYTNIHPVLRPKTKTTQVNKVPIPALSSRNRHTCINTTKTSKFRENKVNLKNPSESEQVAPARKNRKDDVSDVKATSSKDCSPVEDNNDARLDEETNSDAKKVGETEIRPEPENASEPAPQLQIDNKSPQNQEETCVTNNPLPELTIFNAPTSKDECDISTNTPPLKSLDLNMTLNETKNANDLKPMEISLPQSELSNDIFASLHVPSGCQNPESTSPTAAFLMAFPVVSSGVKVTEVIGDENTESQNGTPNLLPIGTMDTTKPTQSLTPNLLNLDSFSFFSNRDSCGGFYNNYNCNVMTTTSGTNSFSETPNINSNNVKRNLKTDKIAPSCRNTYRENVQVERKPHNVAIQKKPIKEQNLNRGHHCPINVEQQAPQLNTAPSFQVTSLANFENKNKDMEPFISKPFDNCSRNLNYKDCNSFNSGKNFNPAYTIAGSNNYFYNSYGNENDNRNYNNQCVNYPDYRKTDNIFPHYNDASQVYNKDKYAGQSHTKNQSNQNKLINWMTTPVTTSYKTDYFIPFSKENDFSATLNPNNFNGIPTTTYFSSSSVYTPSDHINTTNDTRKHDISLPTYNSYRPETEDNQFSWSPNKVPQFLDSHSFVSSTLPTLVGDLALNNISSMVDYKSGKERTRDNRRKVGNYENQSVQSNFLSVSQLVERESVPGKVSSRRNSGSRGKSNTPKKRAVAKMDSSKDVAVYQKVEKNNQVKGYPSNNVPANLYCDAKQNRHKVVPSSYSAEALIGNQINGDGGKKNNLPVQNKSIVPSFLGDNIVPYFHAMDVPQENTYMHANQGYQSNTFPHNFTSFQNNTYSANNIIPSACAISSAYITNNNFMPNTNTQDFLDPTANIVQNVNSGNKDKHSYPKNYNRADKEEKSECKKTKKRHSNEGNLPSFDIPFLSLPGPINSPILPDDFHSTYMPSTTLYPCKNSLYSKPGPEIPSSSLIPPLPGVPSGKSGIQHPEISPSVNSAGTSLTNFNLSAIFPEINKGPIPEHFPDIRTKDYSIPRNFPVTSTIQVPFTSKPSISFSSFGT